MSREIDTLVVQFAPPEVVGLSGVTQVVIYPDRLEVTSETDKKVFSFASIATRQEPRVIAWFKRLVRVKPFPKIVGVRKFCTDRRYVGFFTAPKIKIFTPPDPEDDYSDTFIFRINAVLRSGGYATHDLS